MKRSMSDFTGDGAREAPCGDVVRLAATLRMHFKPPLEYAVASSRSVPLMHKAPHKDEDEEETEPPITYVILVEDGALRLERSGTPTRTVPFAPARDEGELWRLSASLAIVVTQYITAQYPAACPK